MHEIFRFKKWLQYQWRAKTKYYLHSPFVYQFYLNVLEGDADKNIIAINNLRNKLKADKTEVALLDLGTGNKYSRRLSELESTVAIKPKYGLLLYRLTRYFKPGVVLELGASLGISSAYLALGADSAQVITVEGAPTLAAVARSNHQQLGVKNVNVVEGSFETQLNNILAPLNSVDLVFFDGNHRKDTTLKYFEQCLPKANEKTIFIFDDIYWSPEMAEAWELIKQHPQIKLTMDIYQLGICFFIPEKLAKEDFVLRY